MEPNEQKLKAMLAEQQSQCGASIGGRAMMATPSLRDRIRDQRNRAEMEASRSAQLGELDHLLDKHPDFARILDLLEIVRG